LFVQPAQSRPLYPSSQSLSTPPKHESSNGQAYIVSVFSCYLQYPSSTPVFPLPGQSMFCAHTSQLVSEGLKENVIGGHTFHSLSVVWTSPISQGLDTIGREKAVNIGGLAVLVKIIENCFAGSVVNDMDPARQVSIPFIEVLEAEPTMYSSEAVALRPCKSGLPYSS
jgi:hypothetical protein